MTCPPKFGISLCGILRSHMCLSGLLILAALGVYSNSLLGPFIFDDVAAVQNNLTIRHLLPLRTVLMPEHNLGVTTGGRPILNFSFALNYAAHGKSVRGYHIVNLGLHCANGLFLFGILAQSLNRPLVPSNVRRSSNLIAFTIALLWLIHPLQTEAVTYISQRAESLASLFYLATLYFFVRAMDRPATERRWLVSSVAACFVGMGCKETMVTAPILVFLYDRTFVAGTFRLAWERRKYFHLALAATWGALAFLLLSLGSTRGGSAGFVSLSSSVDYGIAQVVGLLHYLRLGVFPHPLIFDYGKDIQVTFCKVWPECLILLGITGATLYAVLHHPKVGFVALAFFVLISPSSSVVPIFTQTWAEHRMYLPLAAEITLLVLGCVATVHHFPKWLLLVPAVALFGGLTLERNFDYRSSISIFADTVEKRPFNARAHLSLGGALFEAGQSQAALDSLRQAVELDPTAPRAHALLARVLISLGRNQDALAHAFRAVALTPGSGAMHYTLGNILRRTGDLSRSVVECERAVALLPNDPVAHAELGTALLQSGQAAAGVFQYQQALKIDPDLNEVRSNLGTALLELGRFDEAVTQFSLLVRKSPHDADAEFLLGAALARIGRKEEAHAHFTAAVKLDPKHSDALRELRQFGAQETAR